MVPPASARSASMIDSGAVYSLLPEPVWQILGLVFDPFRRTLHPMRALLV